MSEQIEIPRALPRGGDVGGKRVVLTPHVVHDAAAAALPLRQDHLDAVPGQHPDGGLVD